MPALNLDRQQGSTIPAVTCWAVSEGAAGTASQVKGLAQAMGAPFEWREIQLAWPWKRLWPGIIPIQRSVFAHPQRVEHQDQAPQLVITCGRQAVMTSLFLKKKLGSQVTTVHIQDPRIDPRRFDFVVAPEHDGLIGPNVLTTRGAIHHINNAMLAPLRDAPLAAGLHQLDRPFVLVLLGGPNKYYRFDVAELDALVTNLRQLASAGTHRLVILPSRRTPTDVLAQFVNAFGASEFVWQRTGENPYLSALAHCSHIICTGDSVSMISEAAATGRPVYIHPLRIHRRARRFEQFHALFQQAGISRIFAGALENWSYEPVNDTERVAQVIRGHVAPLASQKKAA